MSEPVALSLQGIRRTFVQGDRRLEVLRGLTLDLHPGEIVALVGQSGSGKSTLLHIAGLLERPDEGEVVVDGRPAAQANDRERTMMRRQYLGFVYQYHHLLPEFSAVENVILPQMLNGRSRGQARSRALELLDMVKLADRADHRPAELSGGQRQRVTVARALVNEPAIVWADEPTGALDSKAADDVLQLMRRLNQERGQTFVVVTHDPDMAAACDRIVRMHDGEIVSRDTAPEPAAQAIASPAQGA